jgi:hypothetical protein
MATSYRVSVFSDLRKTYPTWSAFRDFLTSEEGGKFRVVGEGRYVILRYAKGVTDLRTPYGMWLRSAVWDTQEHLPVCVAPPKAMPGDVSANQASPMLIQEFLDGIMINAYRTYENPNELVLCTRSQLGASGSFYSKKSFASMLDDALAQARMTRDDLLKLLAEPTEMVPNHFVSFVLQHPEHRVVARCRTPKLWIAHAGCVMDDGTVNVVEDSDLWPVSMRLPSYSGTNVFSNEKQLESFFAALCNSKGWFFQGLTFKDGKGYRWRLRNPNYLYLRGLRGSESTQLDRFLRLRTESKVTEYLKHYTEDRNDFWSYEQDFRKATRDAYDAYCSVHKSHEKKLEDLAWGFRPVVFKLHAHYLEHLRPKNEKVLMKDAVDLVNNLAIYEQKRLLVPASQGPLAAAPS